MTRILVKFQIIVTTPIEHNKYRQMYLQRSQLTPTDLDTSRKRVSRNAVTERYAMQLDHRHFLAPR